MASSNENKKSSRWLSLMDFSSESLISRIFTAGHPPSPPRTVYINENLPPHVYDPKSKKPEGKVLKEHVYATNQVLTSKYTVITFIPRNLLEQFRRVANCFFLGIDILQFFPKFSTINAGLVILPLLAILAITALKDGYEDLKRHQSDRRVNFSKVHVLEGGGHVNPNQTEKKSRTFGSLYPDWARFWKRGEGKIDEEEIAKERKELELVTSRQAGERQAAAPAMPGTDVGPDSDDSMTAGATPVSRTLSAMADPDVRSTDDGHAHFAPATWEDLTVGAIVKLYNNDAIPADIVICATSEPEHVAFVETKNLDGETNLKSRRAVPELAHLSSAQACALEQFAIEAEAPHVNMYNVSAAVVLRDEAGTKSPIDAQTVLLRGTVLRNTGWVIGVVLYTGRDTKIMLNSGGTPSKRSKVERQMNPQVLVNLALLAVISVICAIADALIEQHVEPEAAYWLYDDDRSGDNPHINGVVTFAQALITFQNVIPISLYISIEFVRTCQAAFIYFDKEIWYEKTDSATLARTWNLTDDLGQIEYVMSDKTGTLTQNKMVFRQCSVGGKIYKGDDAPPPEKTVTPTDSSSQTDSALGKETKLPTEVVARFCDHELDADIKRADGDHARSLNGFFNCLALCHTVLAGTGDDGRIEYRAQSPDEAALVQAAADVGFVFRGRDKEVLKVQTPFGGGGVDEYELLNVLEFTSARKRMSVVVRKMDEGDRRLFLLTKGADNVVFERLGERQEELKDQTDEHLQFFAGQGLRTLCLAYRVITEDEYDNWSAKYRDATVSLEGRDEAIEAVCDELERGLRLLGATAIEDKLQDGVPAAIADLKRAGIKVWVATGDKLETAISIGYSTNLLAKDANLIIVRGGSYDAANSAYDQLRNAAELFFAEDRIMEREDVQAPGFDERPAAARRGSRDLRRMNTGISSIVGADNGRRPGGYSLVIDGTALTHALEEPFCKELLLQVSTRCEAVVCCRVSPKQKAQIVRLVKDGLGAMCLAIGDGANDVSMIQAADVGVGITGEEGLQAVNSSDYAIAQFRFLTRLLFVHGHWSYVRNSNMILNFFYKNIVAIGVLFWFQIYCAWSTTYVFEYTYLLFWNVFWSLCPVIAIGIFDRNIDDDILIALPELYRYGRQGRWFGFGRFVYYMLDAVYQSIVVYFFILYSYASSNSARSDGYDIDMYEFSTVMVLACVFAVNFYNGLNTFAWSGWVYFAVFVGPALVWFYTLIYDALPPHTIWTFTYGLDYFIFRSALFWLGLPLAFILALLPRYLWKVLTEVYFPDDIDILRQVRKFHPEIDIRTDRRLGGRLAEITNSAEDANLRDLPAGADKPARDNDLATDFPRPRSMNSGISPISPGAQSQTSFRYPPSTDRLYQQRGNGSRTDMSTGARSTTNRGFDFSTEEGGVAMQRMQSHLSEMSERRRRPGSRLVSRLVPGRRSGESREAREGGHHQSDSHGLFPALRASMRRKKPETPRPTVLAPIPPHGPS